MIICPTKEHVIEFNRLAVAINGDPHGVLNPGNLEYALDGLNNKYALHPEPLIAKAAFLLDYLANKGHVFIEGNKRTSLSATASLLKLNGYSVNQDDEQTAGFVLEVAQGKRSLSEIQKWLKQNIKKIEGEE